MSATYELKIRGNVLHIREIGGAWHREEIDSWEEMGGYIVGYVAPARSVLFRHKRDGILMDPNAGNDRS